MRAVVLSQNVRRSVQFAWKCAPGVCRRVASLPRHANMLGAGAKPKDSGVMPLALVLLIGLVYTTSGGTLFVDVNSTNPVSPYADWSTAATNIQDAIDAADTGDTVLVTNGLYAAGGRVMAGDLTNRVALPKAITVQSVNGPGVTTIQGSYSVPSAGPGSLAVRCAWVTDGALLVGFTLAGGATRFNGDAGTLMSGGGVWCASSNAWVANCVIASSAASFYGGGVYQGSLSNCTITGNSANSGGGAYNAFLVSCRVLKNTATSQGGGAYGGTLRTCAIAGNSSPNGGDFAVWSANLYNCTVTANSRSGVGNCTLTNCIVYFNTTGFGALNYSSSTLAYSCSTPKPSGPGNSASDPQLLPDGIHVASTSPCRGAGTNSVVSGADIDGQPWANPPSIGCDEWQAAPAFGFQPQFQITPFPTGFTVSVAVAGPDPFSYWWSRNGVPVEDTAPYSSAHTANLSCSSMGELLGGIYQVVVSNAFGMVTSMLAQASVHCVDAAGTNPISPYSTWATAATNIQDAINASLAGDWVLVTNGVYAAGGKGSSGGTTNRAMVDKAMTVVSMNGPGGTIVQGRWATPYNLYGVRCAWLTNGAVLSGFTLSGGGVAYDSVGGGGVWGCSIATNGPRVFNCMIVSNLAPSGGGAYQATLCNCTLANNVVSSSGNGGGGAYGCNLTNCVITMNCATQAAGGGTASCNLRNCLITGNTSYSAGGGASGGTLVNCTVTSNNVTGLNSFSALGGVANAIVTNCIVLWSTPTTSLGNQNLYSCTVAYSDSDPLPTGTGNIDADPQFLPDGFHLAASSPCRGAGTNVTAGTDMDGQTWANPPSMGCDEWQPSVVLAGQPQVQVVPGTRLLRVSGGAAGQAPIAWFWTKDGSLVQDGPRYSGSGTSNPVVNGFDAADAGGYQFVVSNALNTATSQVVQVVIHCVDAAATNPVPPYAAWSNAAATIQGAINVAGPGEIVLVADGVYTSGGKAMYPGLTNRVALDKSLTVTSLNGYGSTVIQGAWDTATNGPAAVRCAWLTNGALLTGFRLQGGATLQYPATSKSDLNCGGGAWCASSAALVANCLIRSNSASYDGSGVYRGTVTDSAINNNVATSVFEPHTGGAVYGALVNNCTVTHNSALGGYGSGGLLAGTARNSIIWGNAGAAPDPLTSVSATNCDLADTVFVRGTGNITSDPQLVDDWHIATTSPCRGAGIVGSATGVDMEGETWSNPPPMGCDEPLDSDRVGPLSVAVQLPTTNVFVNHALALTGQITGRAARLMWDFGDGALDTNASYFTSHTWPAVGVYTVALTAYNTDNPGGVPGNGQVNVLPVAQPQLKAGSQGTNSFQFQFLGQAEVRYTIQRATNLAPPIAWQSIQTTTPSADGLIQITDSAATNTAQFYRVEAQ